MKSWMKWAVAAAVGMVAVPVMGLTMAPTKSTSKTPAKQAPKVTQVSANKMKKTTLAASPVAKNMSPRPASVRLGKNTLPTKTTKGHGQVSTAAHATPMKAKNTVKSKPVLMTKTPVRPTTLHTGPAKLPAPKSTLSKAMEKTHTPSSPMKKPANVLSKSEMN